MPLVYWAILLIYVVVGWEARATTVLESTMGSITSVDQRLDSLQKTLWLLGMLYDIMTGFQQDAFKEEAFQEEKLKLARTNKEICKERELLKSLGHRKPCQVFLTLLSILSLTLNRM